MTESALTFVPEPLDQLLAQSRRWPLLTAAEERELAQRIERGDLVARERMINSNVRLVVSVAARYQNRGLPLADIVQEGMFGLIRAVEKFDWRRGFRFSTYATVWIRQSIQRGLENTSRTIRLPVHVGQRARDIAKAESALAAELGYEPSPEAIADAMKLSVEQLQRIRAADQPPTSLDSPASTDGETPLGAILPSSERTPEDAAIDASQADALADAVAALPETERRIIELRFGAGEQGEVHTLSQIGRAIGLSIERTRQIEERALARLARDRELTETLRAA